MELDKLGCSKLRVEDPSLSGAYIRSLVKTLTTTTSKDTTTMNTKDPGCVVDNNVSSPSRNLRKQGKVLGTRHQAQQQHIQQQQQHKKQVRRRLHTSRPYQERLLNMAEARKEIVTALKFHRATMKQASEQQEAQEQQQQQQQQQLSVSHHPSFEQDGRFKSRRNPRIYPSCTTSFSNYMNEINDFSCSSNFSYPPPSLPNYCTWPAVSPIGPLPVVAENPNLTLPNQTLGLNLNLHDFNNLDATLFLNNHNNNNNNNNNNSSFCSYSSPTPSSPPLSVVTDQEIPTIGISQGEGVSSLVVDTIESSSGGGLHAAMDDEGMAEMRSLGEQYQMEWNDTMNLVTSVRWSKFLKNMEHGAAPEVKTEGDANHCIFDELIEFPAWLDANDNCLEQCLEDYFKDPSLPCMDIGDIEFEAKDDEWLA